MYKKSAASMILAIVIIAATLYGIYRYGMRENARAPAPAPRPVAVAAPPPVVAPEPAAPIVPINRCPDGKMLQGECHVRKPGQPNLWIRKSDLERGPAPAPSTMNVASGGVTESERRRLSEFEQRRRGEDDTRDQERAQQVAQLDSEPSECQRIDKELRAIDAASRRALSGADQDYYRTRRKNLRYRQTELHC